MVALQRYQRQIILPEIGIAGQDKLARARVLCIGAGGLGCPALLYLAAAGIGTLAIMDHDTVDESNLQRQILYRNDQIGAPKATAAAANLQAQNPTITIHAIPEKLTSANAPDLFKEYDLIIDGTDNFETKFIINDAACAVNKPFVYGSILGFEGQMAVFNHQGGPCYRCLFPAQPPQETRNCAEAGIIGAVAGIIGSAQAIEAIKIILGTANMPALNKSLWSLDLKTMKNRTIELPKDPQCPTCSNNKQPQSKAMITQQPAAQALFEISAEETKTILSQAPETLLFDVREQNEWDAGHVEIADHMPLSALLEGHRPDLAKDSAIILYCQRGMRSMQALQIMKSQGYNNVKSVAEGYSILGQIL